MGDILYKSEDMVFSLRAGGILVRDGHILLQKPKNDGCAIIGGHVAAFELSADTLRREFMEELHTAIEVGELMAVGEIFFPWGEKRCHQICFYYRVQLADESAIPLSGSFPGYDELGDERVDLDFCWVPLEAVKNGLPVYPQELIPHILANEPGVAHFVSREE